MRLKFDNHEVYIKNKFLIVVIYILLLPAIIFIISGIIMAIPFVIPVVIIGYCHIDKKARYAP